MAVVLGKTADEGDVGPANARNALRGQETAGESNVIGLGSHRND